MKASQARHVPLTAVAVCFAFVVLLRPQSDFGWEETQSKLSTAATGVRHHGQSGRPGVRVRGGRSEGNPLNDLWRYNTNLNNFEELMPIGTAPAERSRHSATAIGSRMYVFGGLGNLLQALDDLQVYDASTNSWEEAPVQGKTGPQGRFDATVVTTPEGNVLIFGGIAQGDDAVDETWLYNVQSQMWEQKAPCPCGGRAGHSAVAADGSMYVFGGRSSAGGSPVADSQIWRYDMAGDNWEQIIAALQNDGSEPVARSNHAVASAGPKMWILGGEDDVPVLNDSWEYDIRANAWTGQDDLPVEVKLSVATVLSGPSGSQEPQTTDGPGNTTRILLLGGRKADGLLNERVLIFTTAAVEEYKLYFAQFGDGAEGEANLFSQISLLNVSPQRLATVRIVLRDRAPTGRPQRRRSNWRAADDDFSRGLAPLCH